MAFCCHNGVAEDMALEQTGKLVTDALVDLGITTSGSIQGRPGALVLELSALASSASDARRCASIRIG